MNFFAKVGLLTIGALALYKGVKASSAIMVANGMVINIIPEIKMSSSGLIIITNLNISNPTESRMELTTPFVKLLHKSKLLSKNAVTSKTIEILPFSENNIPIKLNLSWGQITSLLSTINIEFPDGYSDFEKSMWLYDNYVKVLNALGLTVKYSTYANGFKYADQTTINV